MRIRNKEHYLKVFRAASTVGAAFIARGVYAARYGHAERPDHETLMKIIREIGHEDRSQEEAVFMVEREVYWKDALQKNVIAPWALQAALDELVERGEIEGYNTRGQTWLADVAGVHPRTVRKWVGGEAKLKGASAKLVRLLILDALEEAEVRNA